MDSLGGKPHELNGHSYMVTGDLPSEPGPEFQVVQLRAGCRVDGIILAPSLWGTNTHWNPFAGKKGRSERCTADKGNCAGCDNRLSKRWKGYVHYWDASLQREAFLEITNAAFKQLLKEAPENSSLRGLRIQAKRGAGADNSRLTVQLGLWAGSIDKLPPARDPKPILEILWQWQR
jgi:hypothetical protein